MRTRIIKLSLLTLFITIFSSCEENVCGCTIVDVDVNIAVTNRDDRDLLNPETPGHLKSEDIEIYFVRNGQRVYMNPKDNAPGSFSILEEGPHEKYIMRLYPDLERDQSGTTTTIIKWNELDEDTLTCEVTKKTNSTTVTRVWHNDELKYDQVNHTTPHGDLRLINVVK